MSVKIAPLHVSKCVLIHWVASSVVVTVDIQWMVQDAMVSDVILHHYTSSLSLNDMQISMSVTTLPVHVKMSAQTRLDLIYVLAVAAVNMSQKMAGVQVM